MTRQFQTTVRTLAVGISAPQLLHRNPVQELSYRAEPSRSAWLKNACGWLQRRAPASYGLLAALLMTGLATGLYQEENWRGKRAWKQCKRQLESAGQARDWTAWVPASVPDSENVFQAPEVREWFAGQLPNSLSHHFRAALVKLQATTSNRPVLARLTIISPETSMAPDESDRVLRYLSEGQAAFLQPAIPDTATKAEPGNTNWNPKSPPPGSPESIPLIILDQVPLLDAIRNISRHAGLTCVLEPKIFGADPETGEVPRRLPSVSMRLQNVTAEQALVAVLNKYGFELFPARQGHGRHVRVKDPLAPWLWISGGLREALERSLSAVLEPAAAGAQGELLLSRAVDQVKPVRIDIRTEGIPSRAELAAIFGELLPQPVWGYAAHFDFEPVGTNRIDLRVDGPSYSAADYLAWSDQFRPEFQRIQEALKRPRAQLVGNYHQLSSIPRINRLMFRILVQTQAQRAQAHLLLGRPEAALEELSCVHRLRRLWETKPLDLTGQTMNMAIAGIYVNVVADGLRLGVWEEPQLVVLERQLQDIDLPPLLSEALQFERAVCLQRMTLPADELGTLLSGGTITNVWQVFRYPAFIGAKLAPEGWRCQNMVIAAQLLQRSIDIYDARRHLIVPAAREAADCDMRNALYPWWSPRTCLAAALTPNLNSTWVRTARAQTIVNQALVACALARYRISQGQYPERLEQLAPVFIEHLPHDVLTGRHFSYRRLDSARFLLYSPGWNLIDENGLVHARARNDPTATDGDWVWPSSA